MCTAKCIVLSCAAQKIMKLDCEYEAAQSYKTENLCATRIMITRKKNDSQLYGLYYEMDFVNKLVVM